MLVPLPSSPPTGPLTPNPDALARLGRDGYARHISAVGALLTAPIAILSRLVDPAHAGELSPHPPLAARLDTFEAVMFQLDALADDPLTPLPTPAPPYTRTEHERLRAGLSCVLADRLVAALRTPPRAEAEEVPDLASLARPLRGLADLLVWPKSDPSTAATPSRDAPLLSRARAWLGLEEGAVEAAVYVPLAGTHPAVVAVRLLVRYRPATPDIPAGVDPAARVRWHGFEVATDMSRAAPALIDAADTLRPDHAPRVASVDVVVEELGDLPLRPTVRQVAGRSWELGGLLAILAASHGGTLAGLAATGRVDPASGTIEPIDGIGPKADAILALNRAHAVRLPDTPLPVRRLVCAPDDVAPFQAAFDRLSPRDDDRHHYPPEVVGFSDLEQLLPLAGGDPWAEYIRALADSLPADRADSLVEDWRGTIESLVLGPADGERIVVIPRPLHADPDRWAMALAATAAAVRQRAATTYRGWGPPIPVVVDAGLDERTDGALLGALTEAILSRAPHVPARAIRNRAKLDAGYLLIHRPTPAADATPASTPGDLAELIASLSSRYPRALSRRGLRTRHRHVVLARNLHELTNWRHALRAGR